MTFVSAAPQLRALTVIISDPGKLTDYLRDDEKTMAFLRKGQGFVAIGEVIKYDAKSAADADQWWQQTNASIEHVTELPGVYGTGPIAVGSFVFDPNNSAEKSTLIVPRIVIGRRGENCWLTQIYRDKLDPDPLHRSAESTKPPAEAKFDTGALTSSAWQKSVANVIDLIRNNQAEKVVLARDIIAETDTPIDTRHLVTQLESRYPYTWVYSVDGLIGASPELLVRLRGGLVTSRVLAGTVNRSN
ncbi:MAG: isochorismate synthase, partial [Propionibacterium sp.]